MKQEETYNPAASNRRRRFAFPNRNRHKKIAGMFKEKLLAEFEPVIRRSEQVLLPVKNWMTGHAVQTFIIMIAVILLNTALIWIYPRREQSQNYSYGSIIKQLTGDFKKDTTFNKLPFHSLNVFNAVADLQATAEIRDSLDLLLLKKHLTAEDSLAFIRLAERLQKINLR